MKLIGYAIPEIKHSQYIKYIYETNDKWYYNIIYYILDKNEIISKQFISNSIKWNIKLL